MGNWPLLLVTTLFLLFFGLISILFPMKVIWFSLNWPKWSFLGLVRDEDYQPSMRNAKRLFDSDKKKFKDEYLWLVFGVRILGLGSLFMFAMSFFFVILPALSGDNRAL